ncbi:MAG: patatin-like phospholipase family protein [Hyphomicrobiaceae bacterium]
MMTEHSTKGGPPFTLGLMLPGGGARGAYQAGVLKAIAEIAPEGRNPFPVIAGASVGAINATALAGAGNDFKGSVQRLASLWSGLRTDNVYKTDFASIAQRGFHWVAALTPASMLGVGPPRSLLDNAPLRQLLAENIDFDKIDDAIASGALQALSVTASSYDRGRAVTFFQGRSDIEPWSRARREGVRNRIGVEHIMAAAALPYVFPAERVGHEYFGDGSLRLTSPLSPAIHTGADRILVITARDSRPDPAPVEATQSYPSIGAIGGSLLDIIFLDNVDADIERARRIDHTLSLIAPDKSDDTVLREIEVMVLEPSCDVRTIAREHAHELPWTIRMLMRQLGMWGRDWRLPSYLMFEPGYCGALIDLGYRDTLARRDEVDRFLGLGPDPKAGVQTKAGDA